MSETADTYAAMMRDPRKSRPQETIGGGFFVFRRGRRTNRIRPARFPFEHDTMEAATEAATKLAQQNPGKTFEVYARRSVVFSATEDEADAV